MASLPHPVADAWEKRNGPVIFSTVNDSGIPNTIYVTCVSLYDDETIIVADNYFDKTRKNILAGTKGAILFITNERKAYQLKGRVEYHEKGEIFDDMKSWNSPKHPGVAAAALKVEEIYSGAEKLA